MPPAGALNRCRLYVPARTLWGALTAELARLRCEDSFPGDDYKQLGEDIVDNCRFTYLYPAKKIGDKFLAWLPEYESGRGLVWQRKAGTDPLPDRKFRQLLLDTRPGTNASLPGGGNCAAVIRSQNQFILQDTFL